jgi:uncharacterized membrane protein YadS
MSQVLLVVGVVIVFLSAFTGIYGLLSWNLVLLIQASFSLCTGSAFIIIRSLVRDLQDKDEYLRQIGILLLDLKDEVEKLKKEKASLQ